MRLIDRFCSPPGGARTVRPGNGPCATHQRFTGPVTANRDNLPAEMTHNTWNVGHDHAPAAPGGQREPGPARLAG
jgi:hypothetical protein